MEMPIGEEGVYKQISTLLVRVLKVYKKVTHFAGVKIIIRMTVEITREEATCDILKMEV